MSANPKTKTMTKIDHCIIDVNEFDCQYLHFILIDTFACKQRMSIIINR
jgi:hypothetical protein